MTVVKTEEDNVIQSLPGVPSTPKSSLEFIWKIGCPCRAKYSEDGLFYEARIVDIAGDTCTVRFFGKREKEHLKI